MRKSRRSGDARGLFDADYVVGIFEQATGLRLEQEDFEEFNRWMANHPVGRLLPDAQLYDSPAEESIRFGGRFTVRIWETDERDTGVEGGGLERYLPERGPQEYHVSASARRANAEVMFWGDSGEITPEMEATWALLVSCLRRL